MGTDVLVADLTAVQIRRLQSAGLLVRRMGAAAGANTRWQVSGTAADAQVILDAETDIDAMRRIALQRCPPVPVPADLLAVLIDAARGRTLSDADHELLQEQLAAIAPQAAQMQQLRAAKTSADVETAGGKLWPT